jgi:solute carrier family 25 carnitine/acylcarnitine transporter 20/29
MKILFCGGIAGIVTWASIFPLDVIKTRLQAQAMPGEGYVLHQQHQSHQRQQQPLLGPSQVGPPKSSWEITREAVRSEGFSVFYRGLGICSLRAFIVNAVQV